MMTDNADNSIARRSFARRTALECARRMLNGGITLIEGCRCLVSLRAEAEIPISEALRVLIAVESETDDFPIGTKRLLYAPEHLERLDASVSRYLNEVRPAIMDACREIIREIEIAQLKSCDTEIQ